MTGAIERIIVQVTAALERASQAIDDALACVDASNHRIAAMEAEAARRAARTYRSAARLVP
jgi:hypothetical protein